MDEKLPRLPENQPEEFLGLDEMVAKKIHQFGWDRTKEVQGVPIEIKKKQLKEDVKQELRLAEIKDILSLAGMPGTKDIQALIPKAERYIKERERILVEREYTQDFDYPDSAEDLIKQIAKNVMTSRAQEVKEKGGSEELTTKIEQEKERINREGITSEEIDQIAKERVGKARK